MLESQISALLGDLGFDRKSMEELVSGAIYFTIVTVVAAIATGVIARRRGRSVSGWVLFALSLPVLPLLIVWLLSSKTQSPGQSEATGRSDKESQNDAASARSGLAASIFTVVALAWPFASLGALFMFDSPRAGGLIVWLLFWSTVLYGPVYIFALLLSRTRKRKGDARGALDAWLYLCGGNVAIWSISFILIMAVCAGEFRCP